MHAKYDFTSGNRSISVFLSVSGGGGRDGGEYSAVKSSALFRVRPEETAYAC